jgi:8-amino-7-oxononanoate synthase
MTKKPSRFGLSALDRSRLLARLSHVEPGNGSTSAITLNEPRQRSSMIGDPNLHKQMQIIRSAGELLGIQNPFFRVHEGIAGAETSIEGRRYLNFSSYNYLGLNGHPRVIAAAVEAVERYGTSVSASRLVAGERGLHGELERLLAEFYGTEDCIAFVSGHATNVTVIGNLLSKSDLLLHDALAHNSVLQGAQLAGALRLSFPHNDAAAAEKLLASHRPRHGRALIVIEGHYSMDGDIADLPGFIALARRHGALLMVDEAHSLGVLGPRGRGIAEHFGVDPSGVDLWMGTLSKTLAGCGGFIAARREVVEYLRFSAPGFVYSVGMSPPLAAASIAALKLMGEEPTRVSRLRQNGHLFLTKAKAVGLDTGLSEGHAIIPIVTGSSISAGRLSDGMFRRGINVQPIFYPVVPERSARLRFFLSAEHEPEQIDAAVTALREESARIAAEKTDLAAIALKLRILGS